jgi:hypothetical protein
MANKWYVEMENSFTSTKSSSISRRYSRNNRDALGHVSMGITSLVADGSLKGDLSRRYSGSRNSSYSRESGIAIIAS